MPEMQAMTKDLGAKPVHFPADALTVGAIGIIAYILANVLHEGLGHAGACVLVNGKPLVLSAVHMECSDGNRLVV
jgi:hypothetical protein